MKNAIVTIDSEIMGGTPCFTNTRVPVETLLHYIEGGETLDRFLDGFPGVSREQAVAFLERGKDLLIGSIESETDKAA